jgi:hypothetical protein
VRFPEALGKEHVMSGALWTNCKRLFVGGRGVFVALIVAGLAIGALAKSAGADPLPNEAPKFYQPPLDQLSIGSVTYYGQNDNSTGTNSVGSPNVYTGTFMADDFSDSVSQPVAHISFWGAYPFTHAQVPKPQYVISFLSNAVGELPDDAGTFSEPGTPLSTQIVSNGTITPQSGTYTQTLLDGNAPEPLYMYNAELAYPFPEQAGTTYWVEIAVLSNVAQGAPAGWGWHDRDWTQQDPYADPAETAQTGPDDIPLYHFEDDAVQGSFTLTISNPSDPVNGFSLQQSGMMPQNYIDGEDGPDGIGEFSEDMAFELYYDTPEPGAMVLMIPAAIALARRRCGARRVSRLTDQY